MKQYLHNSTGRQFLATLHHRVYAEQHARSEDPVSVLGMPVTTQA